MLACHEACGQNVSEMPIRVKVEGSGLSHPPIQFKPIWTVQLAHQVRTAQTLDL